MNIQTKRWARPLALFIALTMVMMYSFGGVAFADINDIKVHYKGTVAPGDVIVVETTIGEVTYIAEASYTSGFNYVGAFKVGDDLTPLPVDNSFKLSDVGANIYIKGTSEQLVMSKSSATGGNSLNIHVEPAEAPINYDLGVTKTVNSSSASIGSPVTFTVTVINNGDISVDNVKVTETWPAGLIQGEVSPEQGSFNGTVWSVGTLAAGASKSLIINGTASALGIQLNTAEVEVDLDEDSNPNNNSASASVTVYDPQNPVRDLQITKTVDDNDVTIGHEVTFTIEAKNIGDTEMDGVSVTENVPAGLSVSAVNFTSGTTFTGITWEVGTLNAGEAKYLTIAAVTTSIGSITNTAIGYAPDDETEGNNNGTATVLVNPITQPPVDIEDLEITKLVNQSSAVSVVAGTGVTFTIVVTNIGDITMEAVKVKDTWDSGLTQGTATAAEGTTFDAINNEWEVGTLEPDESKTLTIAAGTPTAGTYTNNVEIVFGELADDNLTNNTAAAIVTVTNPGTTGSDDDDDTPTGTTTTITPTPTPLAEIPETETPLVEAPEVTLEEQPIPLADVPQTGDNTNIWLLLALMMGSGAGIVLLGRRKETVEK